KSYTGCPPMVSYVRHPSGTPRRSSGWCVQFSIGEISIGSAAMACGGRGAAASVAGRPKSNVRRVAVALIPLPVYRDAETLKLSSCCFDGRLVGPDLLSVCRETTAVKLLLVEDDARTARALARGLREEGYVVDVAGSGEDGEQLAHAGDYRVLIV